jgi:hypothetical protein
MTGSAAKSATSRIVVQMPFRVAFSAVLALAAICVFALVPAMQSSPYLYVLTLMAGFGLAVWGFRSLPLPAWGTDRSRVPTLEVSTATIVILMALINKGMYDSLAAAIRSVFGK